MNPVRRLALNITFVVGIVAIALVHQVTHAAEIDFDKQVAPIFVSHCLECHAGAEPEGRFSLTDAKLALSESDSGKAVVPGDAESSLLWQRIVADEMPPKHPLSDKDKATLRKWIDDGAIWGTDSIDMFTVTTSTRAGRDWWSLQPLHKVTPPSDVPKDWIRNEIDIFVLDRIQAAGLGPSPEADPRILIRRLYFDLIGLPPSPEQVKKFVDDPSDAAYQQLVDDLLASTHYGERWGRHWLDVVRFGESDGFERNFPRENAWHYRDWVINALNDDLSYSEFARMQLVGDQLPGGIEGAAATGFWVAGVHNTVVGGSKRMKELARQDEIEDVLAIVGQTFLGLTINCARCHDHKFDPISQKEYYQLASAISGLGYGERVEQSLQDAVRLRELNGQLSALRAELVDIDQRARREILAGRELDTAETPELPTAIARWEFDDDLRDSVGDLHATAFHNARVEKGALVLDGKSFVETPPILKDIAEKTLEVWVQLENLEQAGGAAVSIQSRSGNLFDAIVFGEREPKRWMAGSNSFVRYDSFGGVEEADAQNRPVHIAMVFRQDGTITCYRDGVAYGTPIRTAPMQTFKAGETEILFGLRHKPPGGNRFLKARLYRAAFYDRPLSSEEVTFLAEDLPGHVPEAQLVQSLSVDQRERRISLIRRIDETALTRDKHSATTNRTIYTLTAGAGATTNVLLRGDPDHVGDVVAPAATAAISGLSADFQLAVDASEPDRRRKLAQWVTDDANPLFARVLVNRLWHYHFGVGIVDTPNDLGFNGGRATHPRLLEYLAWQLRENGYRLKPLHRQMVTSSTYRQSSVGLADSPRTVAESIDAENRLLWRGGLRRLDAESIRDAMLAVSGKLNEQLGGPSFKDVSVADNNGTTYYEPIDVDGDEFWRRTVYRFNPRGGRSALLDTFDCPDPASSAPRRAVTTTPLQALSLLNNAFVLRMADYFAERVKTETAGNVDEQITRAWQLAIARDPTESERALSERLVGQHGLSSLCRGLFNFNEFVTVE